MLVGMTYICRELFGVLIDSLRFLSWGLHSSPSLLQVSNGFVLHSSTTSISVVLENAIWLLKGILICTEYVQMCDT